MSNTSVRYGLQDGSIPLLEKTTWIQVDPNDFPIAVTRPGLEGHWVVVSVSNPFYDQTGIVQLPVSQPTGDIDPLTGTEVYTIVTPGAILDDRFYQGTEQFPLLPNITIVDQAAYVTAVQATSDLAPPAKPDDDDLDGGPTIPPTIQN